MSASTPVHAVRCGSQGLVSLWGRPLLFTCPFLMTKMLGVDQVGRRGRPLGDGLSCEKRFTEPKCDIGANSQEGGRGKQGVAGSFRVELNTTTSR